MSQATKDNTTSPNAKSLIVTRRKVLTFAAGAVAAAGALPAVAAASSDPIFAAIEAVRSAEKAWLDANDVAENLNEEIPSDKRHWHYHVNEPEPPADCADDPRWIAAERRYAGLSLLHSRAEWALFCTTPTTAAGGCALMSYIEARKSPLDSIFTGEYDEDGDPLYGDEQDALFCALATLLENLAGTAVQS